METIHITLHAEDAAQVKALKSVMKAMKIKFEISKSKPYNPEFIKKIRQGRKDIREGKGMNVPLAEIQNLWK
jgi:hypothetical protein